MTEPFPFGTALDEAPVEEPAASNRRNLIVLGVVGAVALAAGAYFVLGGSGDPTEESFAVPARSRPVATVSASPGPVVLPVVSTLALGRNPFKALYVAPVVSSGGGGTGTTAPVVTAPTATTPVIVQPTTTTPVIVVTDSTPTTSGGGSTTPTSGGTTAPAPPAAAPAPAASPAPAQSTVALKAVAPGKDGAAPVATFRYDGKTLTGSPGDVMDGKLLLISLQQDATGSWFANLQLGDGSPFEVHERQTVVVQ